jgi:hypothetical protein
MMDTAVLSWIPGARPETARTTIRWRHRGVPERPFRSARGGTPAPRSRGGGAVPRDRRQSWFAVFGVRR